MDWEWRQGWILWGVRDLLSAAFDVWQVIVKFTNFCLKNPYEINLDS